MAQGHVGTSSGTGARCGALTERRAEARAEDKVRWARWWRQVLAVEAQVVKPPQDSMVEVEATQIAMASLAGQRASDSGHRQGSGRQKAATIAWRWRACCAKVSRSGENRMVKALLAGV